MSTATRLPYRAPFSNVDRIKANNDRAGFYFFEPSAMRFFRSRIGQTVYNGRFFITSEQFDDTSPRLYTIRRANDDGSVDTIGEFQGYATRRDAIRAIPQD